jgi:hypothetical protein
MKNETTPKGYDRWDKTCVKFTDTAQKKEAKTSKKAVKAVKKGK